jgi:hypothetical protein
MSVTTITAEMKEIALALLKDHYDKVAPADALDDARKLHTRIVGLGFSSTEATQFASAMLDEKIKAAIAGGPKTVGADNDEYDISAKFDEIFGLCGELFRHAFKKPSGGKPDK